MFIQWNLWEIPPGKGVAEVFLDVLGDSLVVFVDVGTATIQDG